MKGAGYPKHSELREDKLRVMERNVRARLEFERPDLQVKAFWSNAHEGFYVVTGFGFPAFIYVKHLDRWFGSYNNMMTLDTWRKLQPANTDYESVEDGVLTDIYRRGIAGLVKHRILGKVKG